MHFASIIAKDLLLLTKRECRFKIEEMIRFFLLTLASALLLLFGFEVLRFLSWAPEIKLVLYLLFLGGLLSFYIHLCGRFGYLRDWD